MPLRNKVVFFGAMFVFLALAAIPSVILVETAQQYYRFLSGWDPGVLRATRTKRLPQHLEVERTGITPHIHFVEFKLHAPKAKEVLLAGDFNQWKPETLPLSKKSRGQWEIQVPLPPGRYSYLFQVDGTWTQDPAVSTVGLHADMPASILEVRHE